MKEGRKSSNSEIDVSARAPGARRPPSFGCLQLSLPNGGKQYSIVISLINIVQPLIDHVLGAVPPVHQRLGLVTVGGEG